MTTPTKPTKEAPTPLPVLTPLQTQTICPKCGQREDDHDGLGCLYCEHCGYCAHASLTDGVCEFCNQRPYAPPQEPA